jgi:hypothetical protein
VCSRCIVTNPKIHTIRTEDLNSVRDLSTHQRPGHPTPAGLVPVETGSRLSAVGFSIEVGESLLVWGGVAMVAGAGGVEGFDVLLERTRRALEAVSVAAMGRDGGGVSGEGAGADGLVRVRVSPRRVESLSVDPRAMRLGSQVLAAEIVSAVNAAFEGLWRAAGGADAVGDARAAGAGLAGQLRDLQNDSMRSMAMFTQGLADVVARLDGDRG